VSDTGECASRRSIPSVTLAVAIARATGVTVEELFGAGELR
jgi:DNA-binding XRE family transcriptional regulator